MPALYIRAQSENYRQIYPEVKSLPPTASTGLPQIFVCHTEHDKIIGKALQMTHPINAECLKAMIQVDESNLHPSVFELVFLRVSASEYDVPNDEDDDAQAYRV